MTAHHGTCHCGKVVFRIESELADPVRCNCSFCIRRGALLQKAPAERFRLVNGKENLTRYGARDFSDHYFCNACGIHTFTKSTRNGENAVIVNVACLEGVDVNAFEPRVFDGARLL